jgi:Carboxypeptidase regulatory-like domain/TonB-dependent Receptor Plug Domain
MRRISVCVGLVLVAALSAAPAVAAQETVGGIAGVAKDAGGAVLPGATVEALGPSGKVTTVTDERGEYRFPRLPSGRYTVTISLDGFASATSQAEVAVGSVARVEFALALAGISETVDVTATSSVVDITSSAAATSISRERLELLPRGRDFTDVVALAAGAQNESQAGGVAIDGSSGSENRFVIDGIDTTSPQVGTNAVPMRADFFEEVQVKSAGYAAEFGGSTGGVVNAITKSGSDRWSGGVLADFQSRSWGGAARPLLLDSLVADTHEYFETREDDETRIDPGFFLGGPILPRSLWFFGSYQPGIRETKRTVNFTNGVTNTFSQDFRVNYGTFNVSGNAGSKLLYKAGASFSPYETERSLPGLSGRTSLTSADSYLRGTKGERSAFSGSVDYIPTQKLVVSGRVGRFITDVKSTNVEFPGLIHQINSTSTPAGIAALPAEFRQQPGYSSGVLIGDATARDEYKRDYIGVDATWYVSAAGEHQIKGGYQTEKIANDVQSGYNADRLMYYAGRAYTTSTGESVRGTYGYFRLLNISTLGEASTRNEAMFIQDTWKPTSRLTLNIGLRSEHERVPNFGDAGVKNPIEFSWGEKLAPRLGFTYDVMGNQLWKVYGSFGKYFDVMKYELPRGSFGGDKWVDYYYTWDNPNFMLNASGCATGTNSIKERPTCAAGGLIEVLDRRFNSAEDLDSGVEPNLKPMEENEFQFGLSRELGPRFVVGARYIYKDLVRTIEDVGVLEPGIGEHFYIANPGEGITLSLMDPSIPGFPKAKREYQGLELTAEKRFSNKWAAFGSYTYSRLYGNYSGLASSDEDGRTSPNVNRFFDSIENSFDRNGNLVYGRLGTDRPHVFKGQALYSFDWRMTVAANQYVGSGIPISEEGLVGSGVPFFAYGRGNLGRTPVLSRTDLSVFQDVRLAKFKMTLGMTILNLFDQDAVTRRFNNRTASSLPLDVNEFFAGGWNYEGLLADDPTLLDVKFNQPDQWQDPREIRLSVKFTF